MTTRPLTSTLKTLKVLDAMARSRDSMRLIEIARAVGGTRATVYQRIHTLVAARWVEQLPDGSYRLSLYAAHVGQAALEQANLGERTLPVLQDLMERTGETSSLAVIEDCSVVLVQRVEAHGMLRADLRIGAGLSVQESASGRVLTAFAPPEVIARFRQRGVTLASARILAQVRKERFSVAGGGKTLRGISVAAVPVFDHDGRCIASLSVVGPDSRFDIKRVEPAIKAAGARLNTMLAGALPRRAQPL